MWKANSTWFRPGTCRSPGIAGARRNAQARGDHLFRLKQGGGRDRRGGRVLGVRTGTTSRAADTKRDGSRTRTTAFGEKQESGCTRHVCHALPQRSFLAIWSYCGDRTFYARNPSQVHCFREKINNTKGIMLFISAVPTSKWSSLTCTTHCIIRANNIHGNVLQRTCSRRQGCFSYFCGLPGSEKCPTCTSIAAAEVLVSGSEMSSTLIRGIDVTGRRFFIGDRQVS